MRKALVLIFSLLLCCSTCFATETIQSGSSPLGVTDGTNTYYPWLLYFNGGTLYNYSTGTVLTITGGSGQNQTPWLSNINGGGFSLSNVNSVTANYEQVYDSQANSFFGGYSAHITGSATNNNGIGDGALTSITGGSGNNAQGSYALNLLSTGNYNVGIGGNALTNMTAGNDNIAIGYNAMEGITAGAYSDNTTIGYNAGQAYTGNNSLTQISKSIFLGSGANAYANNDVNEIVIGYNLYGNGSNTATIGNNGTTDNYFAGNIHATGSVIASAVATTPILCVKATGGSYYLPYNDGASGQTVVLQTNGTSIWQTPSTSSGGNGTVTSVGTNFPLSGGPITTTGAISIQQASTSASGYIASTDFFNFNSKLASTTTINTTFPLQGGQPLTSNPTLYMNQATTSASGYISSTDWNTFNGKQPSGSYVTQAFGNSTYVPYTGATGSVALGNYSIYANSATAQTIFATMPITFIGSWSIPASSGTSGQVLTTNGNNIGVWQNNVNQITAGTNVTISPTNGVGNVTINASSSASTASHSVVAVFNGGGSNMATGSITWVKMPTSGTFNSWDLTAASTSSTLQIDIWKLAYNTFSIATGPSIVAPNYPMLSSQQKNTGTYFATTTFNTGDYLFFDITNSSLATYAIVTLSYTH